MGAWRPSYWRWQIAEPFGGIEALAGELNTTPLVAQILYNRGIADAQAAKAFLNPKLSDLHDPADLPGALPAAERIAQAVAGGHKIVIYGDYDVDGMTGVAILHSILRMVGAEVAYYVPHRLDEGYGVNSEAVGKLIGEGMRLLITVDCGISAVEPVAEATAAGVDVIVTDHHTPGDRLPDALAIVHPAIAGPEPQYPNAKLAGAGIAFKLAWQVARAICGENRLDEAMRAFLLDATCLAALGTIADMVPLVGDNRVLATYGLRGLPATKHEGLRALLKSASLTGEKLDGHHVGFELGPRLNACGRMGHARQAVELLTGASAARCGEIAEYLARQNTERQKIDRDVTAQAIKMVEVRGLDSSDHRAIVVGCQDWHGGVIGIVASRLVERFARPAIVVAFNGDHGGQGSGRSIPGFHMLEALAACAEHLETFGGHAMAGGLRIPPGRFDAFTEQFLRYAGENITADQLKPVLHIDAEATLSQLSYNVVRCLTQMAPFGQGNAAPMVVVRGCKVLVPPKRMGRNGQTVGMMLQNDGANIRAVGFGMGDLADMLVGVNQIDIACKPSLNTFRGRTTIEVTLRDVQWR